MTVWWQCDSVRVWFSDSVKVWQGDDLTVWKYYSNKSVKVRQNDSVIGKTKQVYDWGDR